MRCSGTIDKSRTVARNLRDAEQLEEQVIERCKKIGDRMAFAMAVKEYLCRGTSGELWFTQLR